MIWLLLILLLLIATGALWLVVKIALGIALGLLLVLAVLAAFVWWRFRRAMRASWSWSARPEGSPADGDEQRSEQAGTGSSQITVFYDKNPPAT